MEGKLIGWIISFFMTVINYLFWGRVKRLENDIDELKKRTTGIEKNYIKRFEEIHSKLGEVEKNIIKEIYSVKIIAHSKNQNLRGEN